MKTVTLALTLVLTGCASNAANIHTSALADSATTFYAIDRGHGEEANPVLPKSAAGAAITSAALKYGIAYAAKRYGKKSTCRLVYKSIVGSGLGAAASNMRVIDGKKESIPLVIGVGLGAGFFAKDSADKFCK